MAAIAPETVESYDEDKGEISYIWSQLEVVNNTAFYEGASVEKFVSEQFRADIDGLILINPNFITNTIENEYRIDIDGASYSVIHNDNILLLDEVYAVAVKRFTNG